MCFSRKLSESRELEIDCAASKVYLASFYPSGTFSDVTVRDCRQGPCQPTGRYTALHQAQASRE